LVAGALAAAALALGIGAPAASALPPDRAYEMVSPPDKNNGDIGAGLFGLGVSYAGVNGDRLAYMALGGFEAPSNSITGVYTAKREESFWESRSGFLPVFPLPSLGGATTAAVSPDASRFITKTNRNPDTGERFQNGDDGAALLYDPFTGEHELVVPDLDVNGNPVFLGFPTIVGSADFSRLFVTLGYDLIDGLPPGGGNVLYMFEDGQLSAQSALPNGTLVRGASIPSPNRAINMNPNPASADGNVIYFEASGSQAGLYRRDFSGATPQTVRVNDPETTQEPGGNPGASFRGASDDGQIVYFTSNQKLVDDDTNNVIDLYQYDHSKPAGQRLTLISKYANPAETPQAVSRVQNVSADGSAVVFSSQAWLLPGEAPSSGVHLYLARNGQISHLRTTAADADAEDLLLRADGEQLVWLTDERLTAHDNGGFAQVYVRDNTTGQWSCASCLQGEANTVAAELRMSGAISWFGPAWDYAISRNLSTEGHVFFETKEALLPQDTNDKMDVYIWQDGELDLISTGRSSDHSFFASATPDGSDVFFITRERLSGWDFDNATDVYTARVDGGLPEPPEPAQPCTGDDCQGPPPLPPAFPRPTTADADGPGNAEPGPVNCTPAERKANQLAQKAKRLEKKAKRLAKKARKASGKKAKKKARKASGKKAKRLRKQAKQVKRQAKNARQQASKARTQLELCREEAQL
jgi:hypothetical protein